jgi:hypothetical protein
MEILEIITVDGDPAPEGSFRVLDGADHLDLRDGGEQHNEKSGTFDHSVT